MWTGKCQKFLWNNPIHVTFFDPLTGKTSNRGKKDYLPCRVLINAELKNIPHNVHTLLD